MTRWLWACLCFPLLLASAPTSPVRSYTGTVTIPTYEHTGREMEPPLFAGSTVGGMYPFTTYLRPYQGAPKPKTYQAIFVENEYLKLTYIPDFGGRFVSIYDKLRQREMLYRNDVVKPAAYNPRNSWPQSGMELTGPHDLHMLTLHGEPYWANKLVNKEDGSVSLVLGELDPVYGMNVTLTATLHPGIAALEISVFCYNGRDGRKPQMFWINTAINATPKTRFIYPMSRTVGHTTADIADWPIYNGVDYSMDRNNKNMLGVFGIDSYDNFQGAYQFDRDYGIFRFADRRIVQGMKLWTFGYGAGAKSFEEGYTDQAGPYVELQSGRHVWDGHYEWVAPHKVESWSEWWVPVSQTGGLTTLTRDVALNLEVNSGKQAEPPSVAVALGVTRVIPAAHILVKTQAGELFQQTADLTPAKPFKAQIKDLPATSAQLAGMVVTVTDASGKIVLDYHRPDTNPGRQEYTPFTRSLEKEHKKPEDMSVEELTLAGEFRLKELDEAGADTFFQAALKRDPLYSRANLQLGISNFNSRRYSQAIEFLQKVIQRDPYSDAAYYYLAVSQFAAHQDAAAERNLFYIWPESAYFGEREFHLGRLSLARGEDAIAIAHFRRASAANGYDLLSRLSLALTLRSTGDNSGAASELAAVERIDPASRALQAERYFLTRNAAAKEELLRMLGSQTQEALSVVVFYRDLQRWKEASQLLQLLETSNADPWGTTPIYYYTLAYCERRAGETVPADAALAKASAAAGKVDRFPYREESLAPLQEAVALRPRDAVARFNLACLLYFPGQPDAAIEQWQAAIDINPKDFSSHRALGLAYAEQNAPIDKAAGQLRIAMELNPAHVRTLDDLSTLYARAGRFDDQLSLLNDALRRSPKDDDLAEGVLTADLSKGRYDDAEKLIDTHKFSPRHRSYSLRDKYRIARYGEGAEAFHHRDYTKSLQLFQSALNPPVSLGIDDFQSQTSPRLFYYIGRAVDALGKKQEAQQAFEKSVAGVDQLSGDRDSWNSENFFMVPSLIQLGRRDEADRLVRKFSNFAETEKDDRNPVHRAEARYLLGLIARHEGQPKQADELFSQALEARPDLLAARLELRKDALNPAPSAEVQ